MSMPLIYTLARTATPTGTAPVAPVATDVAPAAPQLTNPTPGATGPAVNATANAATSTQQAATQPRGGGSLWESLGGLLPMVLIFVLLYFILFRGQRKDEKNRKKQIETMKKGDEVLLISGKFGTVVDIRDDRVVVKVDQANNIKETYLKSAIQRVLNEEAEKK